MKFQNVMIFFNMATATLPIAVWHIMYRPMLGRALWSILFWLMSKTETAFLIIQALFLGHTVFIKIGLLKELEHRKLGWKVLILKYDLGKSLSKEMWCKMADTTKKFDYIIILKDEKCM